MVHFKSFVLFIILSLLWTKAYATRLNSTFIPYSKYSVLALDFGTHFMQNTLSGPSVIDLEYKDLQVKDFALYYEHRILNDWGYAFSYSSSSGTAEIEAVTFVPSTYKFTSYIVEIYSYSELGQRHHWAAGPKVGLDYSDRPFVNADTSTTAQIYKMQTISPLVGFFVDWQSENWLWAFNLSYRYPLFTFINTGDISWQSKIAIKTSLEASYALSRSVRAGLTWQGVVSNSSFDFTSGATSSSGDEELFISTTSIQLNFLF